MRNFLSVIVLIVTGLLISTLMVAMVTRPKPAKTEELTVNPAFYTYSESQADHRIKLLSYAEDDPAFDGNEKDAANAETSKETPKPPWHSFQSALAPLQNHHYLVQHDDHQDWQKMEQNMSVLWRDMHTALAHYNNKADNQAYASRQQ
jgi:hypothetical protein